MAKAKGLTVAEKMTAVAEYLADGSIRADFSKAEMAAFMAERAAKKSTTKAKAKAPAEHALVAQAAIVDFLVGGDACSAKEIREATKVVDAKGALASPQYVAARLRELVAEGTVKAADGKDGKVYSIVG